VAPLWRTVGWRRIAVTALCVVAWRLLDQIPVPGLNSGQLLGRFLSLGGTGPLHAIGGALPLASYSIVLMGVGPYINALVIMTVVRAVSAYVHRLDASSAGRLALNRWTRGLTVPLAFGQAYGWTALVVYDQSPLLNPRLVLALELTAGTMILVFLADIIDDYGIGFGYGAILIYALDPIVIEVHRMADRLASAPSAESLYLPVAIWAAFSIAAVALSLVFLLAVRRVSPASGKKTRPGKPIELKVLMSGVLRPPIFAGALLSMPVFYSEYVQASNPNAVRWVSEYWTSAGPHVWTDIAYVALHALLVIGFVYFVVAIDFRAGPAGAQLMAHVRRLTVAGAILLAAVVVGLPPIEAAATRAAGFPILMSGFDVVLAVAVIVALYAAAQRTATQSAQPSVLQPRML